MGAIDIQAQKPVAEARVARMTWPSWPRSSGPAAAAGEAVLINGSCSGAVKACTSRVKGHMANRSSATSTCNWKGSVALVIASTSGWKVNSERNHGLTVSR